MNHKLFPIVLSFLFLNCNLFAQGVWTEWFDSPYDYYRGQFIFDSTHHTNKWQIGVPSKSVFSSAYSGQNAMVTDTINRCGRNDTSIFYTYIYSLHATSWMHVSINFRYKLDINRFSSAKMEVSGDNGRNWINPLTEDTTYYFYWGSTKPNLDSSTDWKLFSLGLDRWSNFYLGSLDTFPHYRTSDTLWYRFTFITGDDSGRVDGWMMDDFSLSWTTREEVADPQDIPLSFAIYPNPSDGKFVRLSGAKNIDRVLITDMLGNTVYDKWLLAGAEQLSDIDLPEGNYMLRAYSLGQAYVKHFVVNH